MNPAGTCLVAAAAHGPSPSPFEQAVLEAEQLRTRTPSPPADCKADYQAKVRVREAGQQGGQE